MTRRTALITAAGASAYAALSSTALFAGTGHGGHGHGDHGHETDAGQPAEPQPGPVRQLTTGAAKVRLTHDAAATGVWAFNGQVPGPELRFRQGEHLRINVTNQLTEGTTVHWHGLRIPNAMDGVAHVTQPPIAPGETFTYAFTLPDAGTYWYHPHSNSNVQVGRGLYGALIIEEDLPPEVDHDLVWVLDDWRLKPDHQIAGGFDNQIDLSHDGRIGNTITVNGAPPGTTRVKAGERIRLRLINAANARIFRLTMGGIDPMVIAYDGQPVEPHRLSTGYRRFGPGQRLDMIIDIASENGDRLPLIDHFTPGKPLELGAFKVTNKRAQLRLGGRRMPKLRPNPVPEPDLETAERHRIVFSGGVTRRNIGEDSPDAYAQNRAEHGAGYLVSEAPDTVVPPDNVPSDVTGGASDGAATGHGAAHAGPGHAASKDPKAGPHRDHSQHAGHGKPWAINGRTPLGYNNAGKIVTVHDHAPLMTLAQGKSHILAMHNDTSWAHPIHFHGHHFRVVTINGRPAPFTPLRDSVMMQPNSRMEIAVFADNPGDWMFHCHILEHQAFGMHGVIRVA